MSYKYFKYLWSILLCLSVFASSSASTDFRLQIKNRYNEFNSRFSVRKIFAGAVVSGLVAGVGQMWLSKQRLIEEGRAYECVIEALNRDIYFGDCNGQSRRNNGKNFEDVSICGLGLFDSRLFDFRLGDAQKLHKAIWVKKLAEEGRAQDTSLLMSERVESAMRSLQLAEEGRENAVALKYMITSRRSAHTQPGKAWTEYLLQIKDDREATNNMRRTQVVIKLKDQQQSDRDAFMGIKGTYNPTSFRYAEERWHIRKGIQSDPEELKPYLRLKFGEGSETNLHVLSERLETRIKQCLEGEILDENGDKSNLNKLNKWFKEQNKWFKEQKEEQKQNHAQIVMQAGLKAAEHPGKKWAQRMYPSGR